MKTASIYSQCLILLLLSHIAFSQVEFTLDAGELIPHETGFFLGGVTYDFNKDGVEEYISGCPGEFDFEDYERRDPFHVTYDLHSESGEQLGFTYKNCMILSVCDAKYPSELDPEISHGFIQMRPLIDTSDLTLAYSYIESPEIRNLESITMETSADVSIQPDRRLVPYNIEYSKDGGETYVQEYYISDVVQTQGGYRVTYNSENNQDFAQMQAASVSQNIKLRFITNTDNPDLGAYKGQYVKVHKITILADSASTEVAPLQAEELIGNRIWINDGLISVRNGTVAVYSLSGILVGNGKEVQVIEGLYVIVTSSGARKKIFIK